VSVLEQSRTAGLSTSEARTRLARDGPNVLPRPGRRPAVLQFAAELVHFFALMLWVAAGLAWLAGLGTLAVAIAAVVVLNAVFSFVQERRADRAAERLRVLLPTGVRVRRDGHATEVDATDVVIGDLVLLEAGDRVPADGEVALTETLLVDTSMLTGESGSVPAVDGDRVFAGTFVVEGAAEMVVDATAGHTRLATIAALTGDAPAPVTPLTRELAAVVRTIAIISVAVGGGFFLLSWLIGDSLRDGLVFAIGVTVALVPEALLPTVTLSLAWGAERMASKQVLVRHLEAVETLGSTTFVCTDKTGTLTRNEMTVVAAWTPHGAVTVDGLGYAPSADVRFEEPADRAAVERLARYGVLASTGVAARDPTTGAWIARGEPMDAAIDAFARRLGVETDALRDGHEPTTRFAFDARRRTTSAIVDGEAVVKGAPDIVMTHSAPVDGAAAAFDSYTARGLRVLAVATRSWEPPTDGDPGREPDREPDRDLVESGLELCGLIALEDPPREGISDALRDCRRAGVRVAMLTGDHPATAAAIAERIGLFDPDRIGPDHAPDHAPDHVVVSGTDLPADEASLGALLDRDGVVVARVTPEDKLRIARALRARGHVVAMTGDGVNDAPALHEADIGVAMGRSGTDVAREAADLVLLDDHFASIVAGIEQGRATYVNIRRFLTYHLTDNVAELTPFVVWALSGGRFPLALGVLQILAIDLGTDTLTAVALGAEPPAEHVLDNPPISGRLLNRTVARRAFGLLGPTVATMTMLAFLASLVVDGWRPGDTFPTGHDLAVASGAAFLTVVLAQTANAFACRSSTRPASELGWTTNRLLLPAIGFALAFTAAVLLVPPVADRLGQAVPNPIGALVALAAWPTMLVVDTVDKRRRRRRRARR
jgi:magnesium-transporting ATPase (P-type)